MGTSASIADTAHGQFTKTDREAIQAAAALLRDSERPINVDFYETDMGDQIVSFEDDLGYLFTLATMNGIYIARESDDRFTFDGADCGEVLRAALENLPPRTDGDEWSF